MIPPVPAAVTGTSGRRRWSLWRRGAGWLVAALATGLAPAAAAAPAPAEAPAPLVALLDAHVARSAPRADAAAVRIVSARRPLTHVRTVLPVLGRRTAASGARWLRVGLPGRPNAGTAWIPEARTVARSTEWRLLVGLNDRRLIVLRLGRPVRRFAVVVGARATPTPRGHFFVEEAMYLGSAAAGGPYALATSARSDVLQEFDGGPGQIALHGRDNLWGPPGTASSHGCIRLDTAAITWLARRIGAGVPLTVRR